MSWLNSFVTRLALIATVAACAGPSNLPTHVGFNGGPTALMSGQLVEVDGCLYIETPSGPDLLIWPPSFALVEDGVVVGGGRPVARVGQPITVGGGEYQARDYDFLRTRMSNDVPAHCRDGRFWLVISVR
jgi:hypothetical protein